MTKYSYNRYAIPILGFLAVVAISACTKNFDRFNTNPNQATEEMMQYDNLSTGSFFLQMQKNVFPIAQQPEFGDEVYQTMQNLAGDIFSGYMGVSNNWFSGANNSTYALIPQWYGQAFTRSFVGVMPAWNAIKNNSRDETPQVYAMATIIKVAAVHRTTDMYGPLPYINFGNGTLQNQYDSQKDIYYRFFEELNEAIDILTTFSNNFPEATALQKFDFIYGGNVRNWIKFANSLKLRLALRLSYVEPAKAQSEAEAAVSHPVGVFTDPGDVASLKHSSDLSYNHPLFIISENFDDIRMGATMESIMVGYSDPRLPRYFQPASDGFFRGIRNGIVINSKADYAEGPFSKLNFVPTSTIVWMNPAEVYFLRSEGALRGWSMQGDAASLYEAGVRTSFSVSGAAGNANAYLNNDSSVAAPYLDPNRTSNNVDGGSSLLSRVTIKWSDSADFEQNLERIITQKYIAMYPDGQEAWTEFRRTGYPRVFPVVVNNSQGAINSETQIRRLPFPATEYQTNAAGVAGAVGLLGGPDNGGTRLWWDKK